MNGQNKNSYPSALQVNLERTAASVEIPEKYDVLLRVAGDHFGISKQTQELLIELNHPYVNWEYVLKTLKTLSMGDFYVFDRHDEGLEAIRMILDIYLDVIRLSPSENVKETAIRYLFEYLSIVVSGRDSNPASRNLSLVPFALESLSHIAREHGLVFRKSSGNLKALLRLLLEQGVGIEDNTFRKLFFQIFNQTYSFWLTQPDPRDWAVSDRALTEEEENAYRNAVEPLTHRHMGKLLTSVEGLKGDLSGNGSKSLSEYLTMPDHSQVVDGYFLVADQLEKMDLFKGQHHIVKLNFLFHMMNVPGLSEVYINVLREINRSLGGVFREKSLEDMNYFIKRVFATLRKSAESRSTTGAIIDCVTTISREVFAQNAHQLVDTFIDELIRFGFQYPEVRGSTTDWQVNVNPSHITNIRSWLEIIGTKPRWTKRLLSALIINLKLGGVFIRDTDLIQKNISQLLNSDIVPAYNLVKQILRLFPVYFTEIGAEGELRDTSTKVDELSQRNDKLIYFLRKQSHVESNSLLVNFVEDIFRYWHSGSKTFIRKHLPEEVFNQIPGSGEYFDDMHRVFSAFLSLADMNPQSFLSWDRQKVQKELQSIKGIKERDRERTFLIIRLYQLLYKKYNPKHLDLLKDMEASGLFSLAKISTLKNHLQKKHHYNSLVIILDFLATLKEKILSSEKTTYFENIYYKRHIAAGIPSMYGTYKEEKFEAVGFTLRLESLATVLFEGVINSLNLKFITKSTLIRIHRVMWLYVKALELEGISTEGLISKMNYVSSALQVRQFSVDQYVDIFTFISKGIQDIIRDYYIDAHSSNLSIVIRQAMEKTGIQEGRSDSHDEKEVLYQHSESFFRSIISSAFGLQVLDNLINTIIRNLNAELEKFKDNKQILTLVMRYIPELAVSPIYGANKNTDNQILVGNKGYFLKKLASMGFPVPPGFVITTEVFRGHDAVVGYKYIQKDLSHRIYNEILRIEKMTGSKFGDPKNPLLLSVRSGATMSLPGMMRSFLNVGINEAIADGLSKKKGFAWAAWDSYRRYLQDWGMFQGLERNPFDMIMDSFKSKYGVERKIQFRPEQMREVTLAYKRAIEDKGLELPEDPFAQLQQAVLQVFASWHSEQAKTYRAQMHISDEWGTAVIVQQMVFGNLNDGSGSGVIFTRYPKGLSTAVTLYGDFIFGVQGDDIVSGLVETYPVSERQRTTEKRGSAISLENTFPEVYGELLRLSEILIYEKGFNHQELEFTFENPTRNGLFVLQTRDMVQRDTRNIRRFRATKELEESLLGTGIGVGGGALCGRAVYSEEEIEDFRSKDSEMPLILLRPDTVPDDVGILLKVDGLLTSKGGSTSHAAVTIPQLNKVGVVGFNKLKVYEEEGYSTLEDRLIRGGDFMAIDGWSGAVYIGMHEYEQE